MTRLHIVIKLKNTKYKMLLDTGATHFYISKQFFEQIKLIGIKIRLRKENLVATRKATN